MTAVAWIVLGGVVGFLSLVAYIGWRMEQVARSMAEIAGVVQRASDDHG